MRFPKFGKQPNYIKRLDDWFSRYIRLRDVNEHGYCECITCGRLYPPKMVDCGHFISRNYWNHRYNTLNCHAQCQYCNRLISGGDQAKHAVAIDKRYGMGTSSMLIETRSRKGRLKQYQAEALADVYKTKANELLKEKSIARWW